MKKSKIETITLDEFEAINPNSKKIKELFNTGYMMDEMDFEDFIEEIITDSGELFYTVADINKYLNDLFNDISNKKVFKTSTS